MKIDWEIADAFTLKTLENSYKILKKDIKRLKKEHATSDWTDIQIEENKTYMKHLKHVIEYFGGEV